MTIKALMKVVPPPAAPVGVFDGPWAPIEADLGVVLPQDYKDFVRFYGSGRFMEFLAVHVPVFWIPTVILQREVRTICDIFRGDEDLPYPLWPAPGGLLPFGETEFGDFLFWLPVGQPDNWVVVVWDRGGQTFEALACGLTDFLAGLATGEVAPREFPDDMLPCDCMFRPHPPGPSE